jgi:hypothetical protein
MIHDSCQAPTHSHVAHTWGSEHACSDVVCVRQGQVVAPRRGLVGRADNAIIVTDSRDHQCAWACGWDFLAQGHTRVTCRMHYVMIVSA